MRLATTCRAAALALLGATLLAAAASPASAQQQPASRFAGIAQGDTARVAVVRPRGGWATGVVTWTAPDSLALNRLRQRDTVVLGRDNIARLEVKRGQKRSGGAVAIGIIGGSLVGATIGTFLGAAAACSGDCIGYEDAIGALVGFSIGAVGGGIAGGVIGSQRRTGRWVPVMP